LPLANIRSKGMLVIERMSHASESLLKDE